MIYELANRLSINLIAKAFSKAFSDEQGKSDISQSKIWPGTGNSVDK